MVLVSPPSGCEMVGVVKKKKKKKTRGAERWDELVGVLLHYNASYMKEGEGEEKETQGGLALGLLEDSIDKVFQLGLGLEPNEPGRRTCTHANERQHDTQTMVMLKTRRSKPTLALDRDGWCVASACLSFERTC